MGKARAPTGAPIIGTLESIPGTARALVERLPDGTVSIEYEGGTDVHWDGSETVTRDGKAVFVDADGEEWTEDQLVFGEESEEEAPSP